MTRTRSLTAATAARRTSRLFKLVVMVTAASWFAVPAFAVPTYGLVFERTGYGAQYNVSQNTPLYHADAFPVPGTTNGTCGFSGSAFAYPGHVGIENRMEMLWNSLSTGTSIYKVMSISGTNDFVITGPASPVPGQLHFRVRGSLSRAGGIAGSSSHGMRLNVDARTSVTPALIGDLYSTNFDTHGVGLLAGQTSPELEFAFALPGTYPVGVPFGVSITLFATGNTAGNLNSSPNPGYAQANAGGQDAGLFLEEVGGQVLTLPEGYTLNSVGWGIVNNRFQRIVGIEPSLEPTRLQCVVHPNPSTDAVTLLFTLPHAGRVRVQLLDTGGRLIRSLADEWRTSGVQRFPWDGRTELGTTAAAGVYFARVDFDGRRLTRRLVRVH